MGCYLEKSNRAALHLIRKDKHRANATDETENQSEENYTEKPDTPAEEQIDINNAIRPSQEMEFQHSIKSVDIVAPALTNKINDTIVDRDTYTNSKMTESMYTSDCDQSSRFTEIGNARSSSLYDQLGLEDVSQLQKYLFHLICGNSDIID